MLGANNAYTFVVKEQDVKQQLVERRNVQSKGAGI